MDAFIERVSENTDIVRIVQSYVPLKRRGNRYWGCCPFHHEKTASFSVVPDKGFFYCFGCHAGGNAFKFISLIENISYFDAIKLQGDSGLHAPFAPRCRDGDLYSSRDEPDGVGDGRHEEPKNAQRSV